MTKGIVHNSHYHITVGHKAGIETMAKYVALYNLITGGIVCFGTSGEMSSDELEEVQKLFYNPKGYESTGI